MISSHKNANAKCSYREIWPLYRMRARSTVSHFFVLVVVKVRKKFPNLRKVGKMGLGTRM